MGCFLLVIIFAFMLGRFRLRKRGGYAARAKPQRPCQSRQANRHRRGPCKTCFAGCRKNPTLSIITLSATGDSVLGTTEVVLIEKNDGLQKLHDQIVDLLELHGAKFNTPEFTRSGFLPHSTIQKSGRLSEGDKIEINTLFLIDMFPNKNWQQRRVLRKFKLGGVKS